jgi:hypothetical protein
MGDPSNVYACIYVCMHVCMCMCECTYPHPSKSPNDYDDDRDDDGTHVENMGGEGGEGRAVHASSGLPVCMSVRSSLFLLYLVPIRIADGAHGWTPSK